MLPLRSSIMTTLIGWISVEKTVIGCGFPLSRISNVLGKIRHRRRPCRSPSRRPRPSSRQCGRAPAAGRIGGDRGEPARDCRHCEQIRTARRNQVHAEVPTRRVATPQVGRLAHHRTGRAGVARREPCTAHRARHAEKQPEHQARSPPEGGVSAGLKGGRPARRSPGSGKLMAERQARRLWRTARRCAAVIAAMTWQTQPSRPPVPIHIRA